MAEADVHQKNDLEIVETLGMLNYAFLHCIGNRTLKVAYLPKTVRWYTIALWLATIAPPSAAIALQTLWGEEWGWLAIFVEAALMFCVLFPLAKYCIQRGLPNEHRILGITGTYTSHAKSLHLPLLKLLFFKRHIATRLELDHSSIKRCIEFLEVSTKDAPPSWSTYFRHPIPVLLISSFIVLVNVRLSSWINAPEIPTQTLFTVGLLLIWILGLGFMIFSWKYSDSETRWLFLRTLRWLELTMRPKPI